MTGMKSRISIDPHICHGTPVIRGTQVMVSTVVDALCAGDTVETLIADHPELTAEDIHAALAYTAKPEK